MVSFVDSLDSLDRIDTPPGRDVCGMEEIDVLGLWEMYRGGERGESLTSMVLSKCPLVEFSNSKIKFLNMFA